MPLLKLSVSTHLDDAKKTALLTSLSKTLAQGIGKPEKYVMVTIDECAASMSGTAGPAAFGEIRSIGGLGSTVNTTLSAKICGLLAEHLGIAGERVYLNFADVDAENWGYNGGTFA
jgi:phenylpyruvate tautomerase PptA (4-oxalocrotonate tautomerase family)